MAQNVRQALLAARAQGDCACPAPAPCHAVATAIVLSVGLHPPASICNSCRGLLAPPPPSTPTSAFAPLPS